MLMYFFLGEKSVECSQIFEFDLDTLKSVLVIQSNADESCIQFFNVIGNESDILESIYWSANYPSVLE